jgi:anti-sigma regulatory factor (Ser/Thr protein kinase)
MVLEATPEAATRARRFVGATVQAVSPDAGVESDIALAVTEAVTNVIVHAYRDRPVPGRVVIETHAAPASLLLKIQDEGVGMAPRTDSPGLGLGLPLIERLSSHFDVRPGPRGGTEICMSFCW